MRKSLPGLHRQFEKNSDESGDLSCSRLGNMCEAAMFRETVTNWRMGGDFEYSVQMGRGSPHTPLSGQIFGQSRQASKLGKGPSGWPRSNGGGLQGEWHRSMQYYEIAFHSA